MRKIRQAVQSDIESLSRIEENAFGDRRKSKSIEISVKERLCYLLAVRGNDAGFIMIDRLTDGECYIGIIAVAESYRRNGVASDLITHVIDSYPGRRVFGTTVKMNKAMEKAFIKNGFKLISPKNWSELVFQK